MSERYVLNGKTPVPEPDLLTWARWFELNPRHVGLTHLSPDVRVSTVFLGLNHRFTSGPPLLFETLIFGGPHDGDGDSYATWDEADAGHARFVALATQAEVPPHGG